MKKYHEWFVTDEDAEVISSIIEELQRARTKHPVWPKDIVHGAAIVAEESGELVRAALQAHYEGGTIEEAELEAIQTAATCIRFVSGDR